MSDITLSAGIRANLLSLQQTADLMSTTQNRLATGKKVNSALDNPLNFFQSSSLSARANDLSGLLDAMGNGISTIQAANNGINAITSLVQQLKATASQARSDTTAVASTVTGTGAPVGTDASGSTLTVDDGTGLGAQTVTFAAGDTTTAKKITAINTQLATAGSAVTASLAAGKLVFTNSSGYTTTVTATAAIQTDLGLSASATSANGSPSTVRQSLMNQFNDLLTQIDKAAGDSGYNGVNLLNGDQLKLSFNENGSSNITIQSTDASGNKFVLTSANLGLTTGTASEFANNGQLDTLQNTISTALTTLRTQASSLGSSLSVVQTRKDFTKNMINTLQTGADNLVLADTNEEGANLLALQTRQSLSTTALSLSAQADQNVLRLFG